MKGGDEGKKSAAPENADPVKCYKVSTKPDSGAKGSLDSTQTGAVEKGSRAKNKFALPVGKSKCAEEEKSKESVPKKKYTLKDRIKDIKDGLSEILKNSKEKKAQTCKAIGTAGSGPGGQGGGRRMIYPYTLSAKIAQFPYRYYFDNVWLFKYLVYGTFASLPIFIYLGRKSYAPENVAEWKKNREELFGYRRH